MNGRHQGKSLSQLSQFSYLNQTAVRLRDDVNDWQLLIVVVDDSAMMMRMNEERCNCERIR
jgi:hypothetical protein